MLIDNSMEMWQNWKHSGLGLCGFFYIYILKYDLNLKVFSINY